MEREIKFRGKRLNNGEWVVGDLIHKNNGDVAIRTYLNVWVENSDSFTIAIYYSARQFRCKKYLYLMLANNRIQFVRLLPSV